MDMTLKMLDAASVDSVKLAGSFSDIIGDCCGPEVNLRTQLINNFPLVAYLLQTPLANYVRTNMWRERRCLMYKDDNGKWTLKVPGAIWSEPSESSAEECCFVPFEFDKCAGTVPMNLLCLKDCDSIEDELVGMNMRSGSVEGLAYQGETENEVKRRIARLSFAFYQAYNAIYGHDETFVTTGVPLKPFHGLAEVMDNPAVVAIDGGDVYSAFASVGCRAGIIGGEYVVAVNPIIYQSIESVIQPDQFNRYPAGWSNVNGVLRYRGMRFIQDKLVPVDWEAGTGEAWILSGDSVGLYLMDNIFATDRFIRREETFTNVEGGCASECTYYYNFGAAFNSNAAKLMKVVDIPISGACAAGIGDLTSLITPNTIVPNIG